MCASSATHSKPATRLGAVASCCLLVPGCHLSDPPGVVAAADMAAEEVSLEMERNEAGDLAYCDEQGICGAIPNPNSCDVLKIDIDVDTGETCEHCLRGDGTTIYARCNETEVACMVITAPEPDCLVCAHVGGEQSTGAVVYVTCVAEAPDSCQWQERAVPLPAESEPIDVDAEDAEGAHSEPWCQTGLDCPEGLHCTDGRCMVDCRICYDPSG